ncbi:MAG: restriction endonuclease, partial [Chloroflexota bacterium]
DIIPFYFELGDDDIWIDKLVSNYLHTFLQQFLAYRTRDATLAFRRQMLIEQLYTLAEETSEDVVLETIDYWNVIRDSGNSSQLLAMMRDTPPLFAGRTGLNIIVMFDEFQRLDQVVYVDEALTRKHHRITGGFSSVAESSRAPMLIAGSQVTILTEDALSGPMLGRVGTTFIKRLPQKGAAELALKFARHQNIPMSLDLAYTMSRLVDGHPYYIWCLFNTENFEADFTTKQGIKDALTFEVEERAGFINKFWQLNFWHNIETFDRPYAKEILLYLTQYPDTEVYIEQLISDMGLPLSKQEGNQLMRELIWCDLARERSRGFYGGLSDPMLAHVLRIEYGWEIEQIMRDEAVQLMGEALDQQMLKAQQELIDSLRGELRYWTGRFAEMFIDKLMKRHFQDQAVDGSAYFNQAGNVQLNRFDSVFTTVTQPPGATTSYQLDLYGVPSDANQPPWVVEVKNWQTPVNQPDVKHFWEAAQNLAKDKGDAQVRCWFYARNGFTEPAKKFMQEKAILSMDEEGLVKLLGKLDVIGQWHEDGSP